MTKQINIGDEFGFLTVIEYSGKERGKERWLCRCTCGNLRKVNTGHLGTMITHCGCRKNLPRKDLTGKVFTNWTVLRYVGRSRYLCRCKCGTEKEVCNRELQNGDSKSCGCLPAPSLIKDITGQVFGRLTVLAYCVGVSDQRNAIWQCKCNCGKVLNVSSALLLRGRTSSCGCARIDMLQSRTPEQLYERSLKGAKTANLYFRRYHWKTKQELACRGSWEPKVVDYLNENKIDFVWQIPILLPNGKIYIVDLYLPDEDLYVEIKGYPRPNFLEKWKMFIVLYPNSVIWDKQMLQSKGISTKNERGNFHENLFSVYDLNDDIFTT
jgi:hypothetical protein